MPSRYQELSQADLATLVPELLLIGHLIDRSGMPWAIANFGQDEMVQIAIEEWAAASPIYTRRMQSALNFGSGDVPTIFKGLQLDIGAPPQFMDFRFTVQDRWHGGFELASCGALLDVEPMGESMVRGMCHDIEDPTFDATAIATNVKAQMRPVHRPPRVPTDRAPHCAWTVTIDPSHPEAEGIPALEVNQRSHAGNWALDPIDPTDAGQSDYSGPLVSDLDFSTFSRSALIRIADEVCLQMHLLNLSFILALEQRADQNQVRDIATRQLVGIAGIAAERLHRALRLPSGPAGALRVLELHPLLNPMGYVDATVDGDVLRVSPGPAQADGSWIALCGPQSTAPLQAIVRAAGAELVVEVEGTAEDWHLTVQPGSEPQPEPEEMGLVRFSGGPAFTFEKRRSLPLTVV